MYRSWAYILMVVATLAGVVGLLWPSPAVRTIEDIAVRSAPRAEAPAKAPKAAGKAPAKPARSEPAAAPPAVVKKMPPQTTATKRAGAAPQNGLQPNMFGQSANKGILDRGAPAAATPPKPGADDPPRPVAPSRPTPDQPGRDPAPQ